METTLSTATKTDVSNDSGAVRFPCPGCGEHTIVRSTFERKNAIKYACACGFTGPN